MRHLKAKKLGGDTDYRKAMFRSLTLALIENESIQTTPARAKALRRYAERVVTLAKRGNLSGRRRIVQILGSTRTNDNGTNRVRLALDKLYGTLAPRFQSRPGGYTQIFRLAQRRPGDNAEMCVMRYIPAPEEKKAKGKTPVKPTKKTAKAAADKPATKEAKSKKAPEDKPTKKAVKSKEKAQDKE